VLSCSVPRSSCAAPVCVLVRITVLPLLFCSTLVATVSCIPVLAPLDLDLCFDVNNDARLASQANGNRLILHTTMQTDPKTNRNTLNTQFESIPSLATMSAMLLQSMHCHTFLWTWQHNRREHSEATHALLRRSNSRAGHDAQLTALVAATPLHGGCAESDSARLSVGRIHDVAACPKIICMLQAPSSEQALQALGDLWRLHATVARQRVRLAQRREPVGKKETVQDI